MPKYYFQLYIILALLIVFHPFESAAQNPSKEEKKEYRKAKKQEKIDKGKLMVMPFAGPAYTPELKFTIAGGILISFKTNPRDSLIQRSSAPFTIGVSSTGAYFIGTKITSFWMQDKLRIYADLNYKNMPDNYWGVGYEAGYSTPKGDSTTAYKRTWWQIFPKFLWQFKENFFVGPLIDFNYTKGRDPSPGVAMDPYYIEYNDKPFNGGFGVAVQYDSRDIPVNAWEGAFIEFTMAFYGPYLGGDNTYQIYDLDIRKYWQIKRPGSTIAVQLKGRFGKGNVPYGEMSQPGTPFDLRGYVWGQYRDDAMVFGIGEYRYMFKRRNGNIGPHGLVTWFGGGTLADRVQNFNDWLPCFGVGYRFEVQPRMNVRLDFGFGRATKGFYFNFNEAY